MNFDELLTTKVIHEVSTLLRDQLKKDFDLEVGNMELAPISKQVARHVGALFFNAGVQAALETVRRRTADLENDIECLELPVR
ncbi:DUF2164 family protein [Variovorax sp. J22P168]|uniref:DUF2164 family protein n=1 Tax=Variovorax jilinensis TaxID=3053513 RepID=UPI002575CF98|nr:DUF2164 family protein [Variovorax sp. J22P168]MDM0011917.1 DUF2164 family protein [Variovorax sp. J22P168]